MCVCAAGIYIHIKIHSIIHYFYGGNKTKMCSAHTLTVLTITEEKLNTTPFWQRTIPVCLCICHSFLMARIVRRVPGGWKHTQGLRVGGWHSENALLYAPHVRVGGCFHLRSVRTGKLSPRWGLLLGRRADRCAPTLCNIFNDRNSLFCQLAFMLSDFAIQCAREWRAYFCFHICTPAVAARVVQK